MSKAPGADCIPVMVLKKREPELSYILAEFFNICLKESCFSSYWKFSSLVPVFQNVGESTLAQNYRPASILFVVSNNLKILDFTITSSYVSSFLISSTVSGLLDLL